MSEKIKNKDAERAHHDDDENLDEGLEETFPASDPVSATRTSEHEPRKDDDEPSPTRPRRSDQR